MKVGIKLKIAVNKIDKELLFKGKNTYLDCTTFVDLDNKDQYDQNGFISQDVSKEARESGEKGAILGNATVFWRDDGQQSNQPARNPAPSLSGPAQGDDFENFDRDLPF